MTERVKHLTDSETWRISINDKRGDAFFRASEHKEVMRFRRIGNEDFTSVENVLIALFLGFGRKRTSD